MLNECYVNHIGVDPSVESSGEYYAELPVVKNLLKQGGLAFKKPVTFFVGENGTGKSTLLEAIAVYTGFNPEGGTTNFRFASKETHSGLYHHLLLSRSTLRPWDGFFLRAESFYNVASEVDRLYEDEPRFPRFYGGKSLHEQSHGESFLSLVLNRFSGNGLYILDEPEAALSPQRQLALLAAIDRLVREEDAQFIISTHSPILIACPNADIYELTEDDIRRAAYHETENFRVMKEFVSNPERMLRLLLED